LDCAGANNGGIAVFRQLSNSGGFEVRKDSKKSFQVNELENDWGGFLVDADAGAARSFFGRAVEATAHDDPDIVREAWDDRRTIVTSNGRDFTRYIQKFQNPPNKPNCRDLWGLLVIPNAQLDREKGLEAIRHGLNMPQIGLLRWPAAGLMNLCVHLTADGKTEIRRFKRCPFCEDPENDVKIREPWNTWYRSLPTLGALKAA
jgi:hypothetical protein